MRVTGYINIDFWLPHWNHKLIPSRDLVFNLSNRILYICLSTALHSGTVRLRPLETISNPPRFCSHFTLVQTQEAPTQLGYSHLCKLAALRHTSRVRNAVASASRLQMQK